jgi:hypothetical protein
MGGVQRQVLNALNRGEVKRRLTLPGEGDLIIFDLKKVFPEEHIKAVTEDIRNTIEKAKEGPL